MDACTPAALNGFCSAENQHEPDDTPGDARTLSLTPLNAQQLLQLARGSSSSPFSAPLPALVSALAAIPSPSAQYTQERQQQAPAEQQQEPRNKSSLSASTSCLLTSAFTSMGVGLSVGANSGPSLAIPPHGVKAVCGKRAKMEDTFNVQPNFANVQMSSADFDFQNKLPARIAFQVGEQLDQQSSPPSSLPLSPNSTCVPSLSSSDAEASVGGSSISSDNGSNCDTLHFFGVYDGHGGVEAAQHCANRLHHHLSIALALVAGSSSAMHTHDAVCHADPNRTGVQCQAEWTLCQDSLCPLSDTPPPTECFTEQGHAAVDRLFSSAAQVGADAPDCPAAQQDSTSAGQAASPESSAADSDSASSGSEPTRSDTAFCMVTALENALRSAFLKTDEEFAEDGSSAMVGSTAVVALVGTKKMWIANCGDSRAVLCRGSRAFQVTDDHKPEREDEAERVEKAGGQVLYWNGHRVMGVLAMSRAIGDHGLRPYVIPEPEITVLSRVTEDDFLLLASDGLWDVMSNQEAITLAMRCLQRSWDKGTSRKAAVRVAATVLTRAAVDRGSKDNVTVVIIDLKAPQPTSSDGKHENISCEAPCSGPCNPRSLSSQETIVRPPTIGEEAGCGACC